MRPVFVDHGYRQEKRQGLWSWSKIVFALAFAALEGTLLIVPILTVDSKSSKFIPVLSVVRPSRPQLHLVHHHLPSLETPRRSHQPPDLQRLP